MTPSVRPRNSRVPGRTHDFPTPESPIRTTCHRFRSASPLSSPRCTASNIRTLKRKSKLLASAMDVRFERRKEDKLWSEQSPNALVVLGLRGQVSRFRLRTSLHSAFPTITGLVNAHPTGHSSPWSPRRHFSFRLNTSVSPTTGDGFTRRASHPRNLYLTIIRSWDGLSA